MDFVSVLADLLQQHGLFGFFLIIAVIAFWQYGGKIIEKLIKHFDNISSTNERFAASSEDTANLISTLVDQLDAQSKEIDYIRNHSDKMEIVVLDVVRALYSQQSDPEIKIRLENIEKDLIRRNR